MKGPGVGMDLAYLGDRRPGCPQHGGKSDPANLLDLGLDFILISIRERQEQMGVQKVLLAPA
jgi:hypothetical protein